MAIRYNPYGWEILPMSRTKLLREKRKRIIENLNNNIDSYSMWETYDLIQDLEKIQNDIMSIRIEEFVKKELSEWMKNEEQE